MTITAVAKTKVSIGGVTAGTDLTAYEAQTYTEIGEVSDIGEFGDEANVITFETIGDGRVKKAVGTRDAGDLAITVARVDTDAGQIAARAASKTSDHHDFKVVLANGETFYFTGPVSSAKNQFGGPNEVLQTVFTVAISTAITEVAA